jgi:hypothetical protein
MVLCVFGGRAAVDDTVVSLEIHYRILRV